MSLDDVRGVLLPWDQRPSVAHGQVAEFACAVLVCSADRDAELHVNYDSPCSHDHLGLDANKLIDAFARGRVDGGWARLPNGDSFTIIGTREAAERARAAGYPSPGS